MRNYELNQIEKYIPLIGEDVFITPTDIDPRGGAEKFMPSLGEDYYFRDTDIDTTPGVKYPELSNYFPSLGNQNFVNPNCIIHAVSVTLTVKVGATPIVGAQVIFDGHSDITDASGVVTFTGIYPGKDLPIHVTSTLYTPYTSQVTLPMAGTENVNVAVAMVLA